MSSADIRNQGTSKPSIRILFFPRERFPTNRVRITELFGRELLPRGHAIDLVMQAASGDMTPGMRAWNGRVVWIGPTDCNSGILHALRRHWRALSHDLRSLRIAQPSHYDTILVSDKFVVAAVAIVLARLRGLNFVFWLTFPIPEAQQLRARMRTARYPILARLRGTISGWLLYGWILRRSDHVFVQSERMKTDICGHGIDPRRVSPIVTGFDLSTIPKPARLSRSHSTGETTLVYLGTLNSDRQLVVLVDMLARLRKRGLKAKLLMVGDGDIPSDRELIERRARDLAVHQHIEFTGFLSRARALEKVATADIGLSPFYPTPILESTSPTKLVEYFAMGLPVVANDHPEQRLVLHESRGGVCVPWGPRHFARAVEWLMRRTPAELSAMGARGRAWAEANRTYARIADEFERAYLSMLEKKR